MAMPEGPGRVQYVVLMTLLVVGLIVGLAAIFWSVPYHVESPKYKAGDCAFVPDKERWELATELRILEVGRESYRYYYRTSKNSDSTLHFTTLDGATEPMPCPADMGPR